MNYPIYPASPDAMSKIKCEIVDKGDTFENTHHLIKYPFDQLRIGECFTVGMSDANEFSLRITANKTAKRTNKLFTVIKHKDLGLVEVARVG